MIDETLHLNAHETVRLVRETSEGLEVEGTWAPRWLAATAAPAPRPE